MQISSIPLFKRKCSLHFSESSKECRLFLRICLVISEDPNFVVVFFVNVFGNFSDFE